jgi:hypothetical protein
MSSAVSSSNGHGPTTTTHTPAALVAFAWTLVGVPLVYGLFQTVKTAAKLFTG